MKSLIDNIRTGYIPTQTEIVNLLKAEKNITTYLFQQADEQRFKVCGDTVFFRGIIEFSNYCKKNCAYCGIQRTNQLQQRYRMTEDEILAACHHLFKSGQTTVVLQSGEDPVFNKERMGQLIKRIKQETALAVTLSVGVQDTAVFKYWKACGMDRYLLRFETCDPVLFSNVHPDDIFEDRVQCLKALMSLGVQTGSGFLMGLPGQSYESLANDILFCTNLNLDMIGCGPFIPNPDTLLGKYENPFPSEVFFITMALLRLLNPYTHIPATTAFDTLEPNGRNRLLQQGCNVFMPNATPQKYRRLYMLYPNKPCVDETPGDCAQCVIRRIEALGRSIGKGPGHSLKH